VNAPRRAAPAAAHRPRGADGAGGESAPGSVPREKRLGWSAEQVREFLDDLANIAIPTPGHLALHVVAEDPADDRYLEAAVEGSASFAVSGDAHLLRLKEFQGIRVVTPQEFLRVLGDQSA
jgi:predicted nucleic acid-binding protein